MTPARRVDLAVVGAGPAGAAAALGALQVRPQLSVALVDRADFPRDKVCGDGIAPHVLELLAAVGVTGLVDDQMPVQRLRLQRGDLAVARTMARPAWVVPRVVFDQRLVEAAQSAGAVLVRHRVRSVEQREGAVGLDSAVTARVAVGADGAHSVVRRALGLGNGRMAFALRGYSPTPEARRGEQVIVFATSRQPSYAWSFDRGDGLANVGYGELLSSRRTSLTRAELLEHLEQLLPGCTEPGTSWRGHHLPLSSAAWTPARGRVLLAGDAAGLVNPLTGEGIYYAVATGLLAGRAAAEALDDGDGGTAAQRYRRTATSLLGRHLRHTALGAALSLNGKVLEAGLRASAADQRVFDDLVDMGLGRGRITSRMARGLVGSVVGRRLGDTSSGPKR